jgi:NTP pyrophosphatase (non-canonical NTP hydrolase)
MTSRQYLNQCKRTWSPVNDDDLLHCVMGLSTEANELLDALKKSIFYGRELDVRNLKEEMGDIEYYMAIIHKMKLEWIILES